MRVLPPVQIECTSRGEPVPLFEGLAAGDELSVCLASSEGLTALLTTQEGKSARAALPPGIRLLEGDTLRLSLIGRTGGRFSFKLLTVNGQSVLLEASHQEENLLRLGIAPTERNISLAQLLRQNEHAPGPESIAQLEKIITKAPGLPSSVAAFMAAQGIIPGNQEAKSFSRPGQLPVHISAQLGAYHFTCLQIPLHTDEHARKAALFVFRDSRREQENKKQTIVFMALHTQHMGSVEATLRWDTLGLGVSLALTSPGIQKYFDSTLHELKDSLSHFCLRYLRTELLADHLRPDSPGVVRKTGGLDIQI